jgi:hypothetical protein
MYRRLRRHCAFAEAADAPEDPRAPPTRPPRELELVPSAA